MLKIFPIIALFVITSLAGYSQSLDAGFQLGTGFYSMSGLKSINNEVVRSLQFDSEIVSDFPPYFAYRPFILFNFGSYKFGIRYTFNSTGSRVSSKDYSGEYRFDMKIRSPSFLSTCIKQGKYWDMFSLLIFKKSYSIPIFSKVSAMLIKKG